MICIKWMEKMECRLLIYYKKLIRNALWYKADFHEEIHRAGEMLNEVNICHLHIH
jgi:hypothetical protein